MLIRHRVDPPLRHRPDDLRYRPYGMPVDSSGTTTGAPYRWTGREYDPETGFYFLRARYYDPKFGRFLQEDPTGRTGGMNLYAYVDGQPLEARDPRGLSKDWEAFSGIGALDGLLFLRDAMSRANGSFNAGLGWGTAPIPELGVTTIIRYADGSSVEVQGRVSNCAGGKCPGGLTSSEYGNVLRSYQFMQLWAAGTVNALVQAGRVVSDATLSGQLVTTNNPGPATIRVAPDAFGAPSQMLAFVLLHEAYHVWQLSFLTNKAAHDRYGTKAQVLRAEQDANAFACGTLLFNACDATNNYPGTQRY